MAKKLTHLIEDLRVLMLTPPWSHLYRLTTMVQAMDDTPELERLTNDELRAFKGFLITLHQGSSMEPETMIKHVAAHWMGTVDQAIRKLPIGPDAVQCMASLVEFPSDQVTPRMMG